MPPDPEDPGRTLAGRVILNDDAGRFTAFAFTIHMAPECLRVAINQAEPVACDEPAVLDFITTLLSALPPG